MTTDTNGIIVELNDYYAFGGSRQNIKSGTFTEQRKYIGEVFDADTGLNYLNARYYNSTYGKFISQDPVFWEVGETARGESAMIDPQLMNSYSYARNNPIGYSDPSGECFWDVCVGEAALIIGGVVLVGSILASGKAGQVIQTTGKAVVQVANTISNTTASVAVSLGKVVERTVQKVVQKVQETTSTGGPAPGGNKNNKIQKILDQIKSGKIGGNEIMKGTKWKDPQFNGKDGNVWIKKSFYDKVLKKDFHWMEKVGGSGPGKIGTRAQIKSK